MSNQQSISRDDVLYAFAIEEDMGHDTLVNYLTAYPQYASDLVDLSRELSRTLIDNDLLEEDVLSIDAAITRFRANGGSTSTVVILPRGAACV